jgi:hypothetical protein
MRSLLVVLLIAAVVAPTYGEFFKVTGDGSFNTYRSRANQIEGYTNAGAGSQVRAAKYNQHNGWLSFKDAVEDTSGDSLATVLASYGPGAQAYIYLQLNSAMPAGVTAAYAQSIRTGNDGNLVEDLNTSGSATLAAPAAGFVGASELVAWRGASPAPLASFLRFGSGIYTLDDPNDTRGIQGTPWITPSTRLPNTGSTPYRWGPNQAVGYDTGVIATSDWAGTPSGKIIGFFGQDQVGREYWALEDVLGMYNNNARSATTAAVVAAGQIFLGGNDAPLAISDSLVSMAADPRNGVAAANGWLVLPVDAAFLADMANNPEHKGLYFGNNYAGIGAQYSNWGFYTKEQNDASTPYLYITPEPATMILLALGGLVALRRRS